MDQWPESRRAYYAALIKQTRPWEKSTGPKTDTGKATSSKNALKSGARSISIKELYALLTGI